MRNPVVYRTAKKYGFTDYLSCYVILNQCSESVWLYDFRMVLTGMLSCLSAVSIKWSVPAINIVRSVSSLANRTLNKAFLDLEKLDLDLVSEGSNGIEP